MTETVNSTRRAPRVSPFGQDVARRVESLQHQLGHGSASTATLAHLRASITREPGSVPSIWQLTLADLPGASDGDEPSKHEWAAHTALTLYALHQQSRPDPMHRHGMGLGAAVRALNDRSPGDGPRRRFDSAATAQSFPECVHHLRGLVALLRSEQIPLDYGLLADDLLLFQRRNGPDIVRRRWGRQYYRVTEAATGSTTQTTTEDQEAST